MKTHIIFSCISFMGISLSIFMFESEVYKDDMLVCAVPIFTHVITNSWG